MIIGLAVAITALEVTVAIVGDSRREARDATALGRDLSDALGWHEQIQFLNIPLFLLAYVATCIWLQRARANTLLIDPRAAHDRSAIWVWLGWFFPLVHFWFPYQVVRDVQNGSSRRGPVVSVTVWWGAWLVWLFASRAAEGIITPRDPMMAAAMSDTDTTVTALAWISALASVVACVQWCRLVHGITAAQRESLALRDEEAVQSRERPAPPPAWDWRR